MARSSTAWSIAVSLACFMSGIDRPKLTVWWRFQCDSRVLVLIFSTLLPRGRAQVSQTGLQVRHDRGIKSSWLVIRNEFRAKELLDYIDPENEKSSPRVRDPAYPMISRHQARGKASRERVTHEGYIFTISLETKIISGSNISLILKIVEQTFQISSKHCVSPIRWRTREQRSQTDPCYHFTCHHTNFLPPSLPSVQQRAVEVVTR
jgi:hypothetical protein